MNIEVEDEILLEAVSDEEKYDRAVKALFLNPRILAPIIKMAISEFADMPVEDIIDSIRDISDKDAVDDVSAMAYRNDRGGKKDGWIWKGTGREKPSAREKRRKRRRT